MKKPVSLVAALCCVAFIAGSALATERENAPEIGKAAPAFTVVDMHGNTHNLADYRGRYVVLEWLNHDCPFVVKHYDSGNMQMLQKKYAEKGVAWFAIISSKPGSQGYLTPEQAVALSAKKKSKAKTVLLDPEGTVGRAYDAKVTPHMYIIDPEGILIYNGGIDDRPTRHQRDIEGATNYVDQALQEAMAGRPVSVPTSQPYGCTVKY